MNKITLTGILVINIQESNWSMCKLRDDWYIDSTELTILASFPPQAEIHVKGTISLSITSSMLCIFWSLLRSESGTTSPFDEDCSERPLWCLLVTRILLFAVMLPIIATTIAPAAAPARKHAKLSSLSRMRRNPLGSFKELNIRSTRGEAIAASRYDRWRSHVSGN